MRKNSIRGPIRGQLCELEVFFKPVLVYFHRNAWETVVALIWACVQSCHMGFQVLSEHLCVGPTSFARARRLERYCTRFHFQLEVIWRFWTVFLVDRHIGPSGELVYVSLDWTEEGPMMTLSVSLLVEGRALVLWAKTYRKGGSPAGTQKSIENDAIEAIHEGLGERYRVVMLGDRGFGNSRIAEKLASRNLKYVLRIKGDAIGRWGSEEGQVSSWLVAGNRYDEVEYRSDGILKTSLVAVRSQATRRNDSPEQWMLMTNIEGTPNEIADIYSLRWGIECQFDDIKNALGYCNPRWERSESIDRLWFIMTCGLELAVSIGAAERSSAATRKARDWEKNQRCAKQRHGRVRLVSFFTRGLAILRTRYIKAEDLMPHSGGRCILRL